MSLFHMIFENNLSLLKIFRNINEIKIKPFNLQGSKGHLSSTQDSSILLTGTQILIKYYLKVVTKIYYIMKSYSL